MVWKLRENQSVVKQKKCMAFSVVSNVKDIALDCFLFENIKHFLVKKIISLFFSTCGTT